MAEITFQMVLSTIQTTGLLVGIFYYISTLRNAQKTRELTLKNQEQALETRQIATYLEYTRRLQDKDVLLRYLELVYYQEWESFDEWWEKYGPSNPEVYTDFLQLMDLLQVMGVLVDREIIDFKLLYDDRAYSLMRGWERLESIVKGIRVKIDNPVVYPQAEQLMNKIIIYHKKHHPNSNP